MYRIAALLLPLLLVWFVPAHIANAQVKSCVTASGQRIYTDRQCKDVGADTVLPAAIAPDGAIPVRHGVCFRNVQDLTYALENAAQTGDANRIAALYDWAGMGSTAANAVMDRLQVIAARTWVGVRAIQTSHPDADNDSALTDAPPIGLRLEQVESNGHTPAQTSFGLRRRMGCLWLHL